MNIEEIRKGAPKTATHYTIEDGEVVYYAKDYIGRWCWAEDEGGWPVHSEHYERLNRDIKPF